MLFKLLSNDISIDFVLHDVVINLESIRCKTFEEETLRIVQIILYSNCYKSYARKFQVKKNQQCLEDYCADHKYHYIDQKCFCDMRK